MRLINTDTRQFEEFIGSNIPPYAILSHTWEEEEVTYKHYTTGGYEQMKGYSKIDMTCRKAEDFGLDYAWIDTCCIDKSSSAELSEAINSMFLWYRKAVVCFVYLSDLPAGTKKKEWDEALPKCRWFSRGWTLQELIAPTFMIFMDSAWRTRPGISGSSKAELVEELSEITNIDRSVLDGTRSLTSICSAQKMSWAALRKTTRIEDEAYCLLGLFDLNMPLLYGEGEKAFMRLQEEILRSTDDLSILAWRHQSQGHELHLGYDELLGDGRLVTSPDPTQVLTGVLAKSAAFFFGCSQFKLVLDPDLRELSLTNVGIKTHMRVLLGSTLQDPECGILCILPLNCTSGKHRLGLRLRQVGFQRYLRHGTSRLVAYAHDLHCKGSPMDRYLLTKLPNVSIWSKKQYVMAHAAMRVLYYYVLRIISHRQTVLTRPWPMERYDHETQLFYVPRGSRKGFGIMELKWRIPYKDRNGEDSVEEIDCSIISSDWVSAQAQFSIVETQHHRAVLAGIQAQISEGGLDIVQFSRALEAAHIPRTLSVRRSVLGSDSIAVLSITPQGTGRNLQISSGGGFDLLLSSDVYEPTEVPSVRGSVREDVNDHGFFQAC